MPDPATIERLRSMVLSAVELKELTKWPEPVIEEWLNFLDNFVLLSEIIDIEVDQKIEEIATDIQDGALLVPDSGFLVDSGQSLTDVESRAFFFARIY